MEQVATGTDLGETPLYTAAVTGNLPAAKMLVAAGAQVNRIKSPGRTPLDAAARWGDYNMADFLLSAGADPNGGAPETPLLIAACVPGNYWNNPIKEDVVELLLERGANPNQQCELYHEGKNRNHTALSCAVRKGNVNATKLLLEHGAVVDQAAMSEAAVPERSLMKNLLDEALAKTMNSASPAAESAESPRPAPAAGAAAGPVSDIDQPLKSGAARPDDFALIIGIEDYQGLPKAEFGARDAQAVRKHFEALGIPARNIIALTGQAATGNKVKSYLEEWLPLNVKVDSTLFVYFSGHGAPDPQNGQAYLVPWDGDPQFLKSTAYPLKKLYADLAKTKARHVIVALDACFSGAGGRSVLAKGARPLVTKVDQGVAPDGRITILAAASGEQITGTLDDQGHGMFTYFFLKGLGEGKRSAKALFDYLDPRVRDEARRQNREQTPALLGPDSPL